MSKTKKIAIVAGLLILVSMFTAIRCRRKLAEYTEIRHVPWKHLTRRC